MPEHFLAKMVCNANNGLPEDAVNWTFAIRSRDPLSGLDACTTFTAEMKTFMNTVFASFNRGYQWPLATMEYIRMEDAPPRVPFHVANLSLTSSGIDNYDLPSEVAICISYEGAVQSGVNMRRRRGRFYFGPLQAPAQDNLAANISQVQQILNEFGKVVHGSAYDLCVYSRYNHHGVPVGSDINEELPDGSKRYPEIPDALPSSFTPVVSIWADNAYDTQRRRGPKATQRLTASVPAGP